MLRIFLFPISEAMAELLGCALLWISCLLESFPIGEVTAEPLG